MDISINIIKEEIRKIKINNMNDTTITNLYNY